MVVDSTFLTRTGLIFDVFGALVIGLDILGYQIVESIDNFIVKTVNIMKLKKEKRKTMGLSGIRGFFKNIRDGIVCREGKGEQFWLLVFIGLLVGFTFFAIVMYLISIFRIDLEMSILNQCLLVFIMGIFLLILLLGPVLFL